MFKEDDIPNRRDIFLTKGRYLINSFDSSVDNVGRHWINSLRWSETWSDIYILAKSILDESIDESIDV